MTFQLFKPKKQWPSSAYIHSPDFDVQEWDKRVLEQMADHNRFMMRIAYVILLATVLFISYDKGWIWIIRPTD